MLRYLLLVVTSVLAVQPSSTEALPQRIAQQLNLGTSAAAPTKGLEITLFADSICKNEAGPPQLMAGDFSPQCQTYDDGNARYPFKMQCNKDETNVTFTHFDWADRTCAKAFDWQIKSANERPGSCVQVQFYFDDNPPAKVFGKIRCYFGTSSDGESSTQAKVFDNQYQLLEQVKSIVSSKSSESDSR